MKVKKAVILAAGMGTRMLPSSKVIPKEILPVVDTPAIQVVVEEAVASGIEEIVLVISPGKTTVVDHFNSNAELERHLEERGKKVADANHQGRLAAIESARIGWNSSPVSLARVCAELWPLIKDEDWSLVSQQNFWGFWPSKLWKFDTALHLSPDLLKSHVACFRARADRARLARRVVVSHMKFLHKEILYSSLLACDQALAASPLHPDHFGLF